MARTSTTFKKGHPGSGGRPEGTKNGAGKSAWRVAVKRLVDLAHRVDDIQFALVAIASALTPRLYLALSSILRDRQKYYEERSRYLRRPVSSGGGRGFELVFPNGVTNRTWKKSDVTQLRPAPKVKPPRLSDRVGRMAVKKVQQIELDLQSLQAGLSQLDFTVSTGPVDSSARLAALRSLIKAERDLLRRSQDPRPVVIHRPRFRIVFLRIPRDPMNPSADPPLGLLGGHRVSDIWTKEEIEADLLGIRNDAIAFRQRSSTNDQLASDLTSSLDQEDRPSSNASTPEGCDAIHYPKPVPPADHTASVEINAEPGRSRRRFAERSPAKAIARERRGADEDFDLETFDIVEDTPTQCGRCRGHGRLFINATRPNDICTDCKGTGFVYYPGK